MTDPQLSSMIGSTVGKQMETSLRSLAVDLDMPAEMPQRLVEWYREQEKAHQARLAESDKTLQAETRDTLTERWGDAYDQRMETAKEGAKVLPKGLRQALKQARLPDGTRLVHTADFAQALFEIGRLRTKKGKTVPSSDEERLAEIEKVRNTDVDAYHAKGLDREALELARQRERPSRTPGTLTAAEAQEEAELRQLLSDDVDAYQHRQWRGSGKTASARALQLARKRAGESA